MLISSKALFLLYDGYGNAVVNANACLFFIVNICFSSDETPCSILVEVICKVATTS